jgi:hypothetical protein
LLISGQDYALGRRQAVHIIQLAENTAEDASTILSIEFFCKCCGMRLRGSPAGRVYKEKVRAKKKLVAAA